MYENLVQQPLSVGKTVVPARIVLPPMATGKTPDGRITPELCAYYLERARNPFVGMVITEHSYVTLQGKAHGNQVSVADDSCIDGMRALADQIHSLQDQTKLLMQISHAGMRSDSKITGMTPVGPTGSESVHELTVEEIHQLETLFADAAERAQKAGFDGVEVHSAHGYLLSQFFSPLTNQRTDSYGASSVENRVRFLKETVQQVRSRVGADFLIAVRLGAIEPQEGGATAADSAEAAPILEQAGADLIHISGGNGGYVRPGHTEPGYYRDASEAVKQRVSVPVLLTGGVKTVSEAEELLQEGAADLIGIGRAMLKNPQLSL